MSYELHPGAEQDLADALDFYASHAGRHTATRFLDEFERVAGLLVRNPELGTPIGRQRRCFPFRLFPYSVIYTPAAPGIRILVVRHQHRRPGYGTRRG